MITLAAIAAFSIDADYFAMLITDGLPPRLMPRLLPLCLRFTSFHVAAAAAASAMP